MIKSIRNLTIVTTLIFSVGIMFMSPTNVFGQEHPSEHPTEHPTKEKAKTEHPAKHEHPAKTFKASTETMAKAITDYVDNDCKLKGGFFLVYDAKAKAPLLLTLTKVHTERLSQVGENLYFACSDFADENGKIYDLDFFMMSKNDKLEVTEVMIHKEDGEARYSWFEENGNWKRK